MFVQVALLHAYRASLWYEVPFACRNQITAGSLVQVPLGKQRAVGFVERLSAQHPVIAGTMRLLDAVIPLNQNDPYHDFIKAVARYYQIEPRSLLMRIYRWLQSSSHQHVTEEAELLKSPESIKNHTHITLTPEQENCLTALKAERLTTNRPFLLHGVTGSGKSILYHELLVETLLEGKSGIYLVPEVSLAVEATRKFREAFPAHAHSIHMFHSASGAAERRLVWQKVIARIPIIVIGVQLPVFLPVDPVGVIIVDEEHEISYQQQKHPRLNSKEVALLRAHAQKAQIVLGSATPSIQSLFHAKNGLYAYGRLTTRIGTSKISPITIVPLVRPLGQGESFWITPQLRAAIAERLEKGEQTILFLNRRGIGRALQCKACTKTVQCLYCCVALTVHESNRLICHYCGFTQSQPSTCPLCSASRNQFLVKGVGTQQIVTLIQSLFPNARIGRVDKDATVDKKRMQALFAQMHNHELDILIGTQMIAKGLHFPRVTLVGVLWADMHFNMPFFNATEVGVQQLIQVAGRSGRSEFPGEVIIQTIEQNSALQFLSEERYDDFYHSALQQRALLSYPPCGRIALLEFRHENEAVVASDAQKAVDELKKTQSSASSLIILGPALPLVSKIKQIHMRTVLLKSGSMRPLYEAYQKLLNSVRSSDLFFTPHPLQ